MLLPIDRNVDRNIDLAARYIHVLETLKKTSARRNTGRAEIGPQNPNSRDFHRSGKRPGKTNKKES